MDSLTLAISQGSLRRGSAAVYLDVHHPEIEEFIEIRKPSGDFNRKSLNLHHGICITDEFMQAVRDDQPFALRSPKNGEVLRKVNARALWQKILETRLQTGEPYLLFSRHGQPRSWRRTSASWASRCASRTCAARSCCPPAWIISGKRAHRGVLPVVGELRDLGAVEPRAAASSKTCCACWTTCCRISSTTRRRRWMRARYSAMRERSVGLGAMGFHSWLQNNGIPVRERAGARRQPAHVQAPAARGRRRVARAGRRTRRLSGCRRARRVGTLQPQARHRAHRQHLGDLRRHQRLHRAHPRQHLHAQDPVGLVQRAQPGAAQGCSSAKGLEHRGHLAVDPRARRLGAAPRRA